MPFLSSPAHPHSGEATLSATAPSSSAAPVPSTSTLPPTSSAPAHENWRGAWDRRKAERRAAALAAGRIPVPPLPDMRYEQGILASIRGFLRRVEVPAPQDGKGKEVEHAEERAAFVSMSLTKEGAQDGKGDGDLFGGNLRIEWNQVIYVLFKDQLLFPLLQG